MAEKEQDQVQFESEYAPPFTGTLSSGEGRWFRQEGVGYYWTDDNEFAGFLNLSTDPSDKHATNFVALKTATAKNGGTATDAYEGALELVQDADDTVTEVKGNLDDLRKEYLAETGTEAITAAAPAPEDLTPDVSFGITVDEDDTTVLELVKTDPNAVYIRENEAWKALDSEADEEENPTVYGAIWYDVSADAIPIFDDLESEDSATKADFDTVIQS